MPSRKYCQNEDKCLSYATHGDPHDSTKQYCRLHAEKHGLYQRIDGCGCQREGCQKLKCYGLRGMSVRYCSIHKNKQIHIHHGSKSRCNYPGCREARGIEKAGIKWCAKHKRKGIRGLPNDYLKLVQLYSNDVPGRNLEEIIPAAHIESDRERNQRLITEINKRLSDSSFKEEITRILTQYYQSQN